MGRGRRGTCGAGRNTVAQSLVALAHAVALTLGQDGFARGQEVLLFLGLDGREHGIERRAGIRAATHHRVGDRSQGRGADRHRSQFTPVNNGNSGHTALPVVDCSLPPAGLTREHGSRREFTHVANATKN